MSFLAIFPVMDPRKLPARPWLVFETYEGRMYDDDAGVANACGLWVGGGPPEDEGRGGSGGGTRRFGVGLEGEAAGSGGEDWVPEAEWGLGGTTWL